MSPLARMMRQDARTKALGAFCILYGLLALHVSPYFTGRIDPFDSAYPFYAPIPALILSGLVSGHARIYPILCLYIGEGLYPILKGSNLWPLSLIVMPIYLAPSALVYLIVMRLKERISPVKPRAGRGDDGQVDLDELRKQGHW